ncbi:helix-turn-helix domain-containing protein [Alicyclobacillus sp. ALC3]|uniref:helix-turn-helix domain-containing protein n=1 Tax=Alicyclobacillus sp. ALC3 TaxID=2796143 RepID=UPI002379AD24|nr:helix-turn-helix domain-containing protein [Alicyclobacillus sp. ALC3]WDL95669.1 helix-turn-helix domain-containing protein [Alicyclobacillus sp. ALC3]
MGGGIVTYTSDVSRAEDMQNNDESIDTATSSLHPASPRGRDQLHLNLRQAVQHIGNSNSLASVIDQLISTIQSVFHCDSSIVYVVDESKHVLTPHVHAHSNQRTGLAAGSLASLSDDNSTLFPPLQLKDCCQRLQLSPFRWPAAENRPAQNCALFDTLQNAGFSTWFSIPLRVGKQTVGFIAVGYFHYQYLFDDASQVLWEFAQDVTRALLPHLPGNINLAHVESQEQVDLPTLYQQDRMRRLLANHHELTNTLWADDKLPSILQSLSFIVHQPVALLDSFLHPLTTYPTDVPWNELLPSVQHWMTQRQSESRVHLPLSVRTDSIAGESFVITPVQMGSAVLGYVVVWERGARLDDLDVMALQQSTTILAVHFYKHGLHVERLGHGFSELLSKLLDTPQNWTSANSAEALDLGWDVAAPQLILVGMPILHSGVHSVSHETLQHYLGQLRIRLASDYPNVLVARYQNHFVFTLPDALAADESIRHFIEFIHGIHSTPGVISSSTADRGGSESDSQDLSLSFGLSQVVQSPMHIVDGHMEAFTAASLYPVVASHESFLHADDVRVHHLLRPISSMTGAQSFTNQLLCPLENYDRHHQTELMKTLRVYLHHNGSLSDAANALFIHRTSLQYRVGRIEGLISRQLEDAHTRLELQLAFVFRDLQRVFSET